MWTTCTVMHTLTIPGELDMKSWNYLMQGINMLFMYFCLMEEMGLEYKRYLIVFQLMNGRK